MRDGQQQALSRIGQAYQRCLHASEQLDRLVDEASENCTSPPVVALQADFDAQIAVTREVKEFAVRGQDAGPDLDEVPGAAFVLAMYQAATALPADELEALSDAFQAWLADVSRWTPAHIAMPPTRPVSPAHNHVLATVSEWWEFHHERMHDDIVALLTKAVGQPGVTAIGVGAAGELATVTTFDLSNQAQTHRPRGTFRRMMRWVRHCRR